MKFTEPSHDNHIVYELNHDYDIFAKMTTFMGQAVLVGQSSDQDGNVRKYVEVFNAESEKWELKTTEKGEVYSRDSDIETIAYYGLVAYKDKLLHFGGLDTGGNTDSGKQFYYLHSSFGKWERSTKYQLRPAPLTKGMGVFQT